MTRSVASLPLRHQVPAASLRTASTAMDALSPASRRELSREAQCFVLAEMDRAPRSENKVCRGCMLGLTPQQVDKAVRAESGQEYKLLDRPSCKICHLRSLKPEAFTEPFTRFLTENPTIFHAVEYFKEKLAAVGFSEVGHADLPSTGPELTKLTSVPAATRP
jgi:aminopeptidase I